jgi:CxxC-x17-CxxC domain-containing protein
MSADTTLTCRDCGQTFTFTSGEQDYYASRGYSEPGRCPDCRAARKSQRDRGSSYASDGSSSTYGGGYGSGGRGQREMFSATCSSCGKEAQVPFQPSGDKPVYCSECFRRTQPEDTGALDAAARRVLAANGGDPRRLEALVRDLQQLRDEADRVAFQDPSPDALREYRRTSRELAEAQRAFAIATNS